MQSLASHLPAYIESLKGRGLAPSFIKTERILVGIFDSFWGERDFRSLRRKDLYDYVLYLKSRITKKGTPASPRTVQHYALSAKRYVDYLYRSGCLLSNPADGFEILPVDRTSRRPIPTQEEMASILDGIDSQRDRALFELMYSSGLRIAEARCLELSDLKLEERILLIREGKGKKDRYVPFSKVAQGHLVAYLQGDRRTQLRGLDRDQRSYLILGYHGKMTYALASGKWKAALDEAGLEGKLYTLHSIRHACATHLLENGASVRYVQELLGHECLNTTQRYTTPNTDRIKAVYRTFHPRENELYEELDEDYRRRAFALRDELIRNKEAHRLKVLRYSRGSMNLTEYEL